MSDATKPDLSQLRLPTKKAPPLWHNPIVGDVVVYRNGSTLTVSSIVTAGAKTTMKLTSRSGRDVVLSGVGKFETWAHWRAILAHGANYRRKQ